LIDPKALVDADEHRVRNRNSHNHLLTLTTYETMYCYGSLQKNVYSVAIFA